MTGVEKASAALENHMVILSTTPIVTKAVVTIQREETGLRHPACREAIQAKKSTTRMPNNIKTYDGTGDPEDHVKVFQAAAQVERWAMPTWCHMFNSTLIGAARQKKYVKDPVEIHNIKQRDGETIEDFMKRFKIEIGRMKGAPECMRISGFIHSINNQELTKRLNEHVPKTMEEMMIATTAFIRREATAASKKKGYVSWKPQDQSKRHTDKRPDFRGTSSVTPREETTRHTNFTVALHLNFPDQEVVVKGLLSDRGRTELGSLLKKNLDIFAWQPSDMTGVPRSVAEHRLNIWEGCPPLRQKKRGQALERAKAIQAEVQKLVEARIMREVYYHDWLSNPVMVESLCGYPFKFFLDAYKGYHQIQLVEADKEKTAFHTGQLQKWSIMLGEHNITYRPRTSIKGQILADFLNEMLGNALQGVSVAVTQEEPWTLFTDGSSCVDGSAEYEALVTGLRIATQMGVKNVQVNVDSKLVANQVLGTYVAKEDNMIKYLEIVKGLVIRFTTFSISQVPRSRNKKADALSKIASTSFAHLSKQVLVEVLETKSITGKEVIAVIEEEGPTWMTELVDYLKEGILPRYEKEAQKLRLKARQYELIEGVLYKRSFLTPWLRYVGPFQAEYVMRKIHKRSCSMHAGPRPLSGGAEEGQIPDSRHGLLQKVDRSKGGGNDYRRAGEEIRMGQYCMSLRDSVQLETAINTISHEYLLEFTLEYGIPEMLHPKLPGPGDRMVDFPEGKVDERVFPTVVDWRTNASKYGMPVNGTYSVEAVRALDTHQMDLFSLIRAPSPIKVKTGSRPRAPHEVSLLTLTVSWVIEMDEPAVATYSSGVPSAIEKSPLDFAHEDGIPAEIGMPTYRTAAVDVVNNDEELRLNLDLLEERRELAAMSEAKSKSNMMKYYNARVRGVAFKPGDFVYHSNDASHAVAGGKLGPK
nr:reverse transcriptase domain-containing protein [Tanacetum cinerariifolium]